MLKRYYVNGVIMEPSPPKTQKIRKHVHRPFYESNKKTSAEIISEARSCVRGLETKRPFTPVESSRTLFSKQTRQKTTRPPSACSINSSYTDSRLPTGKRLSPISHFQEFSEVESKLNLDEKSTSQDGEPIEFNDNDATSPSYSLHFKDTITPKPPTSLEPKFSKSNRKPTIQRRVTAPLLTDNDTSRRVHSGPKERTPHISDGLSSMKRSSSFGDISNENVVKDKANAYFEENIRPLLKQMELNHLHEDVNSLIINFDMLWKTLEIGNMLGKAKLGSKRRSFLLTSVYKCAADNNPVLLLKLSRLFLALEVSGKNLEVVCKLMFKVTRSKKYDNLFIEEGLIGPLVNLLLQPDQLHLVDSLVYLAGALKFLSLNSVVLNELTKKDAMKAIASLLRYSKEELTEDTTKCKESCHMLVQITSALSNFANIDATLKDFISYDIITLLLDLTSNRFQDSDYFMNVSRILSKLSRSEKICLIVHQAPGSYDVMLKGLRLHYKNPSISVRICYAFGSIANNVTDSRKKIMFTSRGMDLMLEIAIYYCNMLNKMNNIKDEKKSEPSNIEDVLIKVVRVIANLSMDEECGNIFSNSENCSKIFLTILDKSEKICDELVVNVTATINNMSYFAEDESVLMDCKEVYADIFFKLLLCDNIDCVLESIRVLGNLTRTQIVRDLLIQNNIFEVLITLLDSNDLDMIFCTCGVLINMMVDLPSRSLLKTHGCIPKLVNILKDIAETDWLLAGMICQIFWNYSEKINTSVNFFGNHETDDLITSLNELLEPELALDYEANSDISDDTVEFLHQSWQEYFQPVATMLLNRIESHHSELEPIINEPD